MIANEPTHSKPDIQGPGSSAAIVSGLTRFAEVAMAAGQWREAVARWLFQIETVGASTPPTSFIRCSMALCALKEWTRAEEIIDQGLQIHPGETTLQRESAEQAMRRADWPLAKERWSELLTATSAGSVALGFQTAAVTNLARYKEISALELNTQRALALNGIQGGGTVFVVGSGPSLNELTPEQVQQLETHITIGTQRTQFKLKSSYLVATNQEDTLLASRSPGLTQIIQLSPTYQKNMADGILCLKTLAIRTESTIPFTIKAPLPSLRCSSQAIFAALGLAQVMGARRIVLIGVDQPDAGRYYHGDSTILNSFAEDYLELAMAHGWLANQEMDDGRFKTAVAWKVLGKVLGDPGIPTEATPAQQSHVQLLALFVSDLISRGIEVLSVEPGSLGPQLGAQSVSITDVLG